MRWMLAVAGWLSLIGGCDGAPPVADPVPVPEVVDADPEIVEVPAGVPPPAELRVDTGDLDRIRTSGVLRVLVMAGGEVLLPRDGASSQDDRELAALFAQSLGVAVEPVAVERYDDLIPWLNEGKGDIIAARMAATPEREKLLTFSRPTTVVSELLIAKKGAASLPKTVADLATSTVTVRRSSSYRESLDALAAKQAPGLTIADAPEDRDTESLVHDVGTGAIALTVADSDLFDHIVAYNDDVVALFPVATGRQIAWGIRSSNPKLEAAADAFLMSRALTSHAQAHETGDLDQIEVRGSLRVLTRNNATSYFLHKGTQQGFDYELMKLFAAEQGLRLDIVVPPESDDLLPWLLEGKGDVIAAQMTVTPERQAQITFSTPYLFVDEVVVQKAGEAPLGSIADLKGKRIAVRPSSSYRRTLDRLQAANGPFTIEDAPEDLETEQLIGKVGSGELPMTVADSTIAAVELAYRTDVQTSVKLVEQQPIAYGVRNGNPALLAALNAFVEKHYKELTYNVIRKNYFENMRAVTSGQVVEARVADQISPYDALLRRRSEEYGLDWRLMAAQAYQESRFDPQAKSWSGARGLFQVMTPTGLELGFTNLEDPEEGVHAGVKYMAKLIDQFESTLKFKQRVRFALASYNVGKGHVDDARRLAAEMGLDRDKWFGNVEKAMLRLQDPKVARKTKYGYCRGEEPVKYVSEIQTRYENYMKLVEAE